MSAPVIVLSGPPGSGKTTVAALLAAEFARSAHVVGDHFFRYIVGDWKDPTTLESNDQNLVVVDISASAAAGYAHAGYTTILDGIYGPWFLDQVLAALGDSKVHYVVLRADLETSIDRAVNRSSTPTTEQIVRTMHGQFDQLAQFESHVVDTTTANPAQVAAAVFELVTSDAARVSRTGA